MIENWRIVSVRRRCASGDGRCHGRHSTLKPHREGRPAPYVAVKGGERAIANAHRLLAHERRGDQTTPDLSLQQISGQLGRAVDRVMGEGSLYDRELAALAVKQACGDLIEAIFLARAYRTTLPRFRSSEPLDTAAMADLVGVSLRHSRISPAVRCLVRHSTTRTVCSIRHWLRIQSWKLRPLPKRHRSRRRESPIFSVRMI